MQFLLRCSPIWIRRTETTCSNNFRECTEPALDDVWLLAIRSWPLSRTVLLVALVPRAVLMDRLDEGWRTFCCLPALLDIPWG